MRLSYKIIKMTYIFLSHSQHNSSSATRPEYLSGNRTSFEIWLWSTNNSYVCMRSFWRTSSAGAWKPPSAPPLHRIVSRSRRGQVGQAFFEKINDDDERVSDDESEHGTLVVILTLLGRGRSHRSGTLPPSLWMIIVKPQMIAVGAVLIEPGSPEHNPPILQVCRRFLCDFTTRLGFKENEGDRV